MSLSVIMGRVVICVTMFVLQIWLVGDGVNQSDQSKASKGTMFIPFSQFPTKKTRKDCWYGSTPAMFAPKHLENVDSCEVILLVFPLWQITVMIWSIEFSYYMMTWQNWLPRRVMSAWRVAGILHAVEEWKVHECGNMMFDIEKIWKASLEHGFRPLIGSTESKLK